jgi:glyoxylase-like metal-dependent hydrolase (beta-lactamase superfamily II)/rhodanese-related sulfurtransferase
MEEMNAIALRERLEAGEALSVVDIRETDEFDSWHIFGSRNIPVYDALRAGEEVDLAAKTDGLSTASPVVTVCRSGVMSKRAAALLESAGFKAISLQGGIRGWGAVWSVAGVPFDKDGAVFLQIRRNGKGCLSYLFGRDGQACVVDPCVDVDAYLETAKDAGLKIVQVLETHVHADHLSRARELARITGADLLLPRNERVTYDYVAIDDGSDLTLGGMRVEAIGTPGHTGESTCYLVEDQVLLTGDTLFATAVGRPDLEKGDAGAEDGAHLLFGSLREKLLGRFEDIPFYPAHTSDAIGFDKQPIGGTIAETRKEQSLLALDEPAFVERILGSLQAKPPNHYGIIAVNEGKKDLGAIDPLDVEAGPNRCAAGGS